MARKPFRPLVAALAVGALAFGASAADASAATLKIHSKKERDGVFLFIHIFALHSLQFVKVESIRRSRAVSSTVVTCPLRWG